MLQFCYTGIFGTLFVSYALLSYTIDSNESVLVLLQCTFCYFFKFCAALGAVLLFIVIGVF